MPDPLHPASQPAEIDTALPSFKKRALAMATVSIGTVLMAIDISLPTVALPTVARDLQINSSTAVQLVTVYQLVLVMTLLPIAALGERLGYRATFMVGLSTFVAGGLCSYLAPNFPLLLTARGIQALGASATMAVTVAIIRSIFSDAQLGRALAAHSVVVSTANAFAPALGGLVVTWFDWRAIFVVCVPLAVLALLCSPVLPPSVRRPIPFDWLAALLCAMAFGMVTGGLELAVHSPYLAGSIAMLAGAAIVGTVFVRRELSQAEPILPLDLIRQRIIALSVLGSFLAFIAAMLVTVTMPFRLAEEFGFSPGEIGALMAPWPTMMMFASPIAAILSDRIQPALLGSFGMVVSVIGMVALFFLPDHPTWFDIAWRMAVSGLGFAFYTAPNARLVLQTAPRHRTASAGGLTSTTRLTGQVLGSGIAAALLSLGIVGSSLAPALAAVVCLVALGCSLARRTAGRADGDG